MWALDPDNHDGANGLATLAGLERQYGPLPRTPAQRTGSGGEHRLFRMNGVDVRNSAGKLGPGIDVRGNGGYIVLPPSVHPCGGIYKWLDDAHPADVEPADAPEWLYALIQKKPEANQRKANGGRPNWGIHDAYVRAAVEGELGRILSASEGSRNETLNRAAFALGQFVGADALDRTDAEARLLRAARAVGLDDREALKTINSGLNAGERQPRDAPQQGGSDGNPNGGSARQNADHDEDFSAPPPPPEPPRPLTRELPPAEPFPVAALGSVLGNAAQAILDRVQVPIGAQSVLAAAALAVQGHADIELPIGRGSRRPVGNYFITVAASGDRKSEADRQALWPIEKHEAALRAKHDIAHPAYLNRKLAWDKAREAATRKNKEDMLAMRQALEALGSSPQPPLEPMLTAPEPTFEGLCRLFMMGHPSLGIFSTEGGQFIGGHGMSEDNRIKTAAGLSDLWDGKPIRRVRVNDGATILPGRRLSVHLMAQPGVASGLFSDERLADQGLLSRLLVAAPESIVGSRMWHEEQPETDRAIRRYGARLLDILEAPLPLRAGTTNELEPRAIALFADARGVWIKFVNHIEREIAPGGALEPIRGLANKLAEHAARLAAVLALVEDLSTGEIQAAEIEAGIVLAEYYASEALRLHGAARVSAELILAQRLLNWLLTSWGEPAVSLPDIYQRSLNAIGDKATAAKLVSILEDHGWLARIHKGAAIAGHQRRDAWRIVRG